MKPENRIIELMFQARQPLSGTQIGGICALGSWRLYPLLARLEKRDILESEWEEALVPGAPRRRVYKLSRFIP